MFVAIQVASATDFHGDGEFIAIELLGVRAWVRAFSIRFVVPVDLLDILGKDVDELSNKIAVGTRRRRIEDRLDLARDREIVVERLTDVGQNVGSVIDEALVAGLPTRPVATRVGRRDRPRAVWHRVRWIRYVASVCIAFGGTRHLKAQGAVDVQVQLGRDRVFQGPLQDMFAKCCCRSGISWRGSRASYPYRGASRRRTAPGLPP